MVDRFDYLINLPEPNFGAANIMSTQENDNLTELAHSMLCHDPERQTRNVWLLEHDSSSQGVRHVKSLITTIALAVLAVSSFAPGAAAQDGGSGALVTVLDVAMVFKENKNFDTEMKKIKTEAESLKSQIQQQQEAIKAKAMQISQYEAGSSERNEMEATVEQEQAALRTSARQAEAELLNREARVYFDTYTKMKSVVGNLAAKHNIALVIRFDGGSVDPASRPDVIKAVNRSVVFHKDIDLTNMVIDGMGPRVAKAAPAVNRK